ncbi:MAG: signal peptidase II [Ornithinimicrobium sp.]
MRILWQRRGQITPPSVSPSHLVYAVQAAAGTALTIDSTRALHRSNLRWILILAFAWIALDQVTKTVAEQALKGEPAVPVLGELLQFRLVYNSGAAFSMGTGNTWVFTVLATLVVTALVWTARRVGHRGWAVALALLIGGAGGNLVDRLTRPPSFGQGHVVDFFALPHFPVFNVADIGISCAAVLIAVLALRGASIEGPHHDRVDAEVEQR